MRGNMVVFLALLFSVLTAIIAWYGFKAYVMRPGAYDRRHPTRRAFIRERRGRRRYFVFGERLPPKPSRRVRALRDAEQALGGGGGGGNGGEDMDNGSTLADAGSDVGDDEHGGKMNGAAAAPARGRSSTTAAGRSSAASGVVPATTAVIDHAVRRSNDSRGVNHNPRAVGIKVKVAHARKKSTGDAAVVDPAGPAPAVVDTAHATANASPAAAQTAPAPVEATPAAAQTAPAAAAVNGASAAGNGTSTNGAPAATNGATPNGTAAAAADEAPTPADFTYSARARTVIRRSNGGASAPGSPAAGNNNNNDDNDASVPATVAAAIAANNDNFHANSIHVEPFAGDDVFAAEFGGAVAEGGAGGKSVAFAAGSPGKGW